MIPLILKNKGRDYKDIDYKYRDLNAAKTSKALLTKNRGDLRTHAARIKQTTGKVLDKNLSLGERTSTLFCQQGIKIMSIHTALTMSNLSSTILTIVLPITGVFGGGGKVLLLQGHLNQKIKEPCFL